MWQKKLQFEILFNKVYNSNNVKASQNMYIKFCSYSSRGAILPISHYGNPL